MNLSVLRFKPQMAWNERTVNIYQKIEGGIARLQSKCNDSLPDLTDCSLANSQNFLLEELERMLLDVDTIHADIKRLQILKVWLCTENTAIISNLLQNNSYLDYDEQQLEKIIRIIC